MENLYSFNFSTDKSRWKMWYIIALSVVIWLVIWWFLTRQYVMSFLIILISWIWFFVENNSPEQINVRINSLWIQVNNNFYEFTKIYNYAFIYDSWNAVILRLALKKKWLKYLDLNVDNNITYDLKQILPNFLDEDENLELTFTDKIIKLLKL